MDPKKLFKELEACRKADKKYSFADRNDGMVEARLKREKDTYIMNTATGEAWQIIGNDGVFTRWSLLEVNMAAINDYESMALKTALARSTRFGFSFWNRYENGVACVCWRLQPDGCYYADSDGFGGTDDDEVMFSAYINRNCDVLIPFQPMDNNLRERYRIMAEAIDRDPQHSPYLCLNRALTVPTDKLADTGTYLPLLKRLTRMAMLCVYDGLANPAPRDDDDDDDAGDISDRIGAFWGGNAQPDMSTVMSGFNLNANPDRFVMCVIVCEPDEDEPGFYGLSLYVSWVVDGRQADGVRVPLGRLTVPEVSAALRNVSNADVLANEIARAVRGMVKD